MPGRVLRQQQKKRSQARVDGPARLLFSRKMGFSSSDLGIYLKSLAVAAALVGPAATIQVVFVFKSFGPQFVIVPALLILLVGGLLGRVIVLREQLRRKSEEFHAIAELAQEFTYFRRVDGQYEYVSSACTALTGYGPEAFYRVPSFMDQLIHPDDRERWHQHVHEINNAGIPVSLDLRIVTRQGEVRWISHLCGPVHDEQGRQTGVRSTNLDITQRKDYEDRIERMAYYDALTDLPNRRSLQRVVRDLILGAAHQAGQRFALLFLDLDRFKHLNDSFGHTFGDRLLRQMANRLQQVCLSRARLTRFGGDEFVVVLPEMSEPEEVMSFAQNLIEVIERPFQAEGRELYISASIGIAIYPHDGEDVDTLVRHADAAMYQSKRDRQGAARFYRPEFAHNASTFISTETSLRRALRESEFTVFYQPKVNIDSDEIVGLEALARWQDPERGWVSPTDFISVAEETGLIHQIGEKILAQVCRQVHMWQSRGLTVPVAVNVSARQFSDPDFCALVERTAHDERCPLSLLEIEVTEQILLDDVPGAVYKIEQLRRQRVRFSLDDFGTGYSSLSYLRSLPMDQVKIDRSFTRDLSRNPRDQAILRAVIGLCRDLDLEVVTEGVETREQRDLLRSLGCRIYQGFLYCEPLPASEIEPLLRASADRGGLPGRI